MHSSACAARNMLSKMTFFVYPESPISSKFLIFIQILLSYCRLFKLQTNKVLLVSKSKIKMHIKSLECFYLKHFCGIHNVMDFD